MMENDQILATGFDELKWLRCNETQFSAGAFGKLKYGNLCGTLSSIMFRRINMECRGHKFAICFTSATIFQSHQNVNNRTKSRKNTNLFRTTNYLNAIELFALRLGATTFHGNTQYKEKQR